MNLHRIYPKPTKIAVLRHRFVEVMEMAGACERTGMYGHLALMLWTLEDITEEIKRLEVKQLKKGEISNYVA